MARLAWRHEWCRQLVLGLIVRCDEKKRVVQSSCRCCCTTGSRDHIQHCQPWYARTHPYVVSRLVSVNILQLEFDADCALALSPKSVPGHKRLTMLALLVPLTHTVARTGAHMSRHLPSIPPTGHGRTVGPAILTLCHLVRTTMWLPMHMSRDFSSTARHPEAI